MQLGFSSSVVGTPCVPRFKQRNFVPVQVFGGWIFNINFFPFQECGRVKPASVYIRIIPISYHWFQLCYLIPASVKTHERETEQCLASITWGWNFKAIKFPNPSVQLENVSKRFIWCFQNFLSFVFKDCHWYTKSHETMRFTNDSHHNSFPFFLCFWGFFFVSSPLKWLRDHRDYAST